MVSGVGRGGARRNGAGATLGALVAVLLVGCAHGFHEELEHTYSMYEEHATSLSFPCR